MLPDFIVPVPSVDADAGVVARDVAACVFFHGFPAGVDVLIPDALSRDVVSWTEGLLTRVIVEPRLTPELVSRLGRDGCREVVSGYLRAIAPRSDAAVSIELPDRPASGSERDLLECFAALPTGVVRQELVTLAGRLELAPATLWRMPISEWLFNWRMLRPERVVYTNDPGLAR